MKYLIPGFVFGVSMSVISWIVAIVLNSILAKTEYYPKLSNFNFITSTTWNKRIGLGYFKWMVKNTPFKFFNPGLKVNPGTDLTAMRHQMTLAEISHLIGFVVVVLAALYMSFRVSIVFGAAMMIPNLFLNLYPSLLQQENKRRIDKLLSRQIIAADDTDQPRLR